MSKRILFIAAVSAVSLAILGYSTGFSPSVAVQNDEIVAPADVTAELSPAARINEAFAALGHADTDR